MYPIARSYVVESSQISKYLCTYLSFDVDGMCGYKRIQSVYEVSR